MGKGVARDVGGRSLRVAAVREGSPEGAGLDLSCASEKG